MVTHFKDHLDVKKTTMSVPKIASSTSSLSHLELPRKQALPPFMSNGPDAWYPVTTEHHFITYNTSYPSTQVPTRHEHLKRHDSSLPSCSTSPNPP